MTLLKFEIAVASADGVGESDRVWFPKWLRRYAMTFPQGLINELAVNRETTLQFSRMLLEAGAPAWQRWQAVRSLECYRDMVLGRSEPDLSSIIAKLAQLGKQERNLDLEVPPTEEELAIIRGKMDPAEPALIQTMRGDMRVLHYSMATEKAYSSWVKRFMGHVGSTELALFNERDIESFFIRFGNERRGERLFGESAWKRLKVIQSLMCYRRYVPSAPLDDLKIIQSKLEELARAEKVKAARLKDSGEDAREEIEYVIGHIDPSRT